MTISKKVWIEVKTRYEAGESVREIERRTGVSSGGICTRAKVEGWKKGRLQQDLNEVTIDVARRKADLQIKVDSAQISSLNKIIEERNLIGDQLFNLSKGVMNITSRALRISALELQDPRANLDTAGKAMYVADKANAAIERSARMHGINFGEDKDSKTKGAPIRINVTPFVKPTDV